MRLATLAVVLCTLALVPACRSGQAVERTPLIVRGGPLLQDVFPKLVADFESLHPEIDVRTDFSCPPCVLTTRMQEGLAIDVFVSAGDLELKMLGEGGVLDLSTTVPIGSAELVLAVPPNNPANVTRFGDVHRLEVKHIAVGHPDSTSPGHYTRQALEKMGLWAEVEHKLVFSKTGCEAHRAVLMGQAEAAFVYNFCIGQGADQPKIVEQLRSDLHDPIVLALTQGKGRSGPAIDSFVEYMKSPAVQAVLRDFGIGPAPGESEEPS